MRVMVMIKSTGADEEKAGPTQQILEAMGAYNEQLVKAGIMLDGNGLRPSRAGAKVVLEGGSSSVIDGPFTEAKEIIAGYWIWQVDSFEEAIEWVKRCPVDPSSGTREVLEVRQIAEVEDFGAEYTPELQERDDRLADELRSRQANG